MQCFSLCCAVLSHGWCCVPQAGASRLLDGRPAAADGRPGAAAALVPAPHADDRGPAAVRPAVPGAHPPPCYRFSLACRLILALHTFTRAASHTLSLCHASIATAATFSSSLRTTSSRRSAPSGRCVVRPPRTLRPRVLLLALNLLGVSGCRLHGRAWGVRCPACLRLSPSRQSESLTRILRDQQNAPGAWLASMA